MTQIEADFITIRNFLYDNRRPMGVSEIAEKSGVRRNVVLFLLKEKRLSISNSIEDALTCEICHRPVTSGRVCARCRDTFVDALHGRKPAANERGRGGTASRTRTTQQMYVKPGDKPKSN
jgi:hypothetical protein